MKDTEGNQYDAIIIGAGPGGSAIAVLLGREGWDELLVDKNPIAGGKMFPVHKGGFNYEMFPINAVHVRNSLFEQLIRNFRLEEEIEVIYPKTVERFYFE